MATSKAKAKAQALPSKAQAKASELALIGFDEARVAADCRIMSDAISKTDELQMSKQQAAHDLAVHARECALLTVAEGGVFGDELAKAWTAKFKTLYPVFAKEGLSIVKTTEKDDGTVKHTLSSYGQNVNSTCRGFCEYEDIEPDAEGRISKDMEIVSARRAEDRSDDQKILADAKEKLAEALKELKAAALGPKGDDAGLIVERAEAIEALALDWVTQEAEAEAIEAEAEAA
jgi:hypothetical protein